MKAFVAESIFGSFAFGEDGNVLAYAEAEKDIGKLVEQLLEEEQGKPLPHTIVLIERILGQGGIDEIVLENESTLPRLPKNGVKYIVETHHFGAKIFRQDMVNILERAGFKGGRDEIYAFQANVSLELTRRKLRKAAQKRDQLAIQAIRAVDDIDKTINLFSERLREWYSVHFPELDKMIEDHRLFSTIIERFGYRDNITKDGLMQLGLPEQRASKIEENAKKSLGADLSDDDIRSLKEMASDILTLFSTRDYLTDYIESVMKEVAPNVTALVGSSLGARLLSLAGGLAELSKLPASTIQVLGAEKALFRALKSRARPPKHGILFQYPAIHTAPRWQRGKMARALAAKLAIAAKIDAYSGRYVGDSLREQVQKRIEEIKEKYPNPPPRKEGQAEERREEGHREKDRERGGKWKGKKGGKWKGGKGRRR